MVKREHLLGWAIGLVWMILGLAIMYIMSLLMEAPKSLSLLIGCWTAAWPLLCGGYCGWRRGSEGFMTGLAAFVPLYLVLSLFWWWLLPGLWSLTLCAKALLGGMVLAALAGGFGAGLKQARRQMQLPPSENGLG